MNLTKTAYTTQKSIDSKKKFTLENKTSFLISPINNLEEGIKKGKYNSFYKEIPHQILSLQQIDINPKQLYLIPISKIVSKTDCIKKLEAMGFKPCSYSPNYLLGLMAQVMEICKYKELQNKCIIALEFENSIVLRYKNDYSYFLCVSIIGKKRKLDFVRDAEEFYGNNWIFIAEDL
jgi:hypothetical protein